MLYIWFLHNGFVATHALAHMIYDVSCISYISIFIYNFSTGFCILTYNEDVPKCTICHKAIAARTGERAYCFTDFNFRLISEGEVFFRSNSYVNQTQ